MMRPWLVERVRSDIHLGVSPAALRKLNDDHRTDWNDRVLVRRPIDVFRDNLKDITIK